MKFLTAILIFLAGAIAADAKPKEFAFIPAKGAGPFPVAIWLHGYRAYNPDGYIPSETRESMQRQVDDLGVAIVGFPATAELHDGTHLWSEEPVADHAYIQARLKAIAGSHRLDLQRVALFGFSQGAMVAADVATHFPANYRGAVLMSPGGITEPKPAESKVRAHQKQVFFCFCGEKEHEGNVRLTTRYAFHLEKELGAKVTLKLYPGMEEHARPPDFMQEFPKWMEAILK